MDNVELLVHIAAPATVQHDKRTLALAQAIVNFEVANVTHIMTCAFDRELVEINERTSNASNTHPGYGTRILKRARSTAFPPSNPPYRNPFHGPRQPLRSWQTPAPATRPQTAPERSSGTIQVPQTRTERRRAYSDSFQSMLSKISDSQEAPQTSSEGQISSPLADKQLVQSLSQTSLDGVDHANKRIRINPLSPSDSLATTVTASPSQTRDLDGARPYSSQPAPDKSPSVVVLSSGSSQRGSSHVMNPQDLFASIDGLPVEICSPHPTTTSQKFESHVTQPLKELMDSLPLHKVFKPMRVTRDAKALERGYWYMPITVAQDDVVQQARSSPSKDDKIKRYTERFTAASAQERMEMFWKAKEAGKMRMHDYGDEDAAVGLWTETEFLSFWNDFAGFIQKGKAGWGVRMVREDVESAQSDTDRRHVRLRVFTWGEIIGHMYLAIWICSDKLSVRIPMEWRAGDGATIVAMSGKKKYSGQSLKRWTRKGPEGDGGSWGVDDQMVDERQE